MSEILDYETKQPVPQPCPFHDSRCETFCKEVNTCGATIDWDEIYANH